jgi:hypothetical protein
MHDARERLGERAQRDDAGNPLPGEDENALAEVPQPGQAEGNPDVATVTIAEPVVTNVRAHRDPKDDGQMHD